VNKSIHRGRLKRFLWFVAIATFASVAQAAEVNGTVLNLAPGRTEVLVYLRGSEPVKPLPPEHTVWRIANRRLAPPVLVVRVDQKFTIRNADSTDIVAYLAMNKNKGYSTLLFPGREQTYSFAKPEGFARVHLHDVGIVFSGWLCVLESDAVGFALTNGAGQFVIPNIPAGKYIVEAVSSRRQKASQKVEVGTESVALNIEFEMPAR
jgi:hypothetical protein